MIGRYDIIIFWRNIGCNQSPCPLATSPSRSVSHSISCRMCRRFFLFVVVPIFVFVPVYRSCPFPLVEKLSNGSIKDTLTSSTHIATIIDVNSFVLQRWRWWQCSHRRQHRHRWLKGWRHASCRTIPNKSRYLNKRWRTAWPPNLEPITIIVTFPGMVQTMESIKGFNFSPTKSAYACTNFVRNHSSVSIY